MYKHYHTILYSAEASHSPTFHPSHKNPVFVQVGVLIVLLNSPAVSSSIIPPSGSQTISGFTGLGKRRTDPSLGSNLIHRETDWALAQTNTSYASHIASVDSASLSENITGLDKRSILGQIQIQIANLVQIHKTIAAQKLEKKTQFCH